MSFRFFVKACFLCPSLCVERPLCDKMTGRSALPVIPIRFEGSSPSWWWFCKGFPLSLLSVAVPVPILLISLAALSTVLHSPEPAAGVPSQNSFLLFLYVAIQFHRERFFIVVIIECLSFHVPPPFPSLLPLRIQILKYKNILRRFANTHYKDGKEKYFIYKKKVCSTAAVFFLLLNCPAASIFASGLSFNRTFVLYFVIAFRGFSSCFTVRPVSPSLICTASGRRTTSFVPLEYIISKHGAVLFPSGVKHASIRISKSPGSPSVISLNCASVTIVFSPSSLFSNLSISGGNSPKIRRHSIRALRSSAFSCAASSSFLL